MIGLSQSEGYISALCSYTMQIFFMTFTPGANVSPSVPTSTKVLHAEAEENLIFRLKFEVRTKRASDHQNLQELFATNDNAVIFGYLLL